MSSPGRLSHFVSAVKPIPIWIRALVVVAFVNTALVGVGVAMLTSDLLALGIGATSWAFVLGCTAVVLVGMSAPLAPRARASRWLRAIVVIVAAHVFLLFAASRVLAEAASTFNLPIDGTASRLGGIGALALTVLAVAWAFARGGVPRSVRATAAFFVTATLALALALPFVTRAGGGPESLPIRALLIVSAAPAACAACWVALAERPLPKPVWVSANVALALIVVAASIAIPSMRTDEWMAFLRGIDVVLACSFLASAAMCAVAFMQWRAVRGVGRRPAVDPPRVLAGVVESSEDVVGWFRYLGVLRGMRTELGAFTLVTDERRVEVPPGATLVARLPSDALEPSPGDRYPGLCAGDAVIVSGFVAPSLGGAFRSNDAPVPGPRGLSVFRGEEGGGEAVSAASEVVFAVWRPFLVYVVAVTVGSIPVAVAVLGGIR